MHRDFDRALRKSTTAFGVFAAVGVLLNLAFWIGLIGGALYLVKYLFF